MIGTHDNIDNQLQVIQELMQLGTLDMNWAAAPVQKVKWALEVATGLQYLHSQQPSLIHSNINW